LICEYLSLYLALMVNKRDEGAEDLGIGLGTGVLVN
jgi:hypothetical protein